MTAAPKNKPQTVTAGKGLARQHTRQFTGTNNPRCLRVIASLRRRALSREEVDSIAGCSNGPELVAELRRRGLELPCVRIHFIDRDGRPCRPGVYFLTIADRRKLNQWQDSIQQGKGAANG